MADMALWELRHYPEVTEVLIYSDSKYVVNGIEWATKWASQGWMTNAGKPALNVDLWLPLLFFKTKYNLALQWVKGHAGGDWGNELADQLAWKAARGDQFVPDKGYKP